MLPESVSCCSDDIGHLKGGPTHRLISLLERFTWSGLDTSRASSGLGTACRWPGQVQVDGSVGELGMTQQDLDGAQIGAGLEHVGGETVPKRVRRHMLADTSMFRGLRHCL